MTTTPQPHSPHPGAHHEWDEERAESRIRALTHLRGPMLPILHALQEEFGYIDDRAIPLITDALNVSRAEVVGVIHFYHDFKMEPQGRSRLQVCRAEACQSMGCEALVSHIEERLGVPMGGTTEDGAITVEEVYCLGNCALSPAVMLDGRLYGQVNARRVDALIQGVREGSVAS